MGYRYESLEDGQVIETAEPREDLDGLARWKRSDAPDPVPAPTTVGAPNPVPVAGPVNTEPVTGGEPPLLSVSAGIANPADTLTTEQARERAAEDAARSDAAAQAAVDAAEGKDTGSSTPESAAGSETPERPGLNGSTEAWAAYAKHVGVELPDDAMRDTIIAAYVEKFAPAGNASGEKWATYAADHGVHTEEGDGRDAIRAAVVAAGWATA